MRTFQRATIAVLSVAVLSAGLSGCSSNKRWCEHDATDTVVDDSYCKKNTPGYEWESGSNSTYKKKKKRH
ncbi:hypothetical protein [Nocardia sp. NPDC048505]|uniref:hypothetical protein n=1 Tax=unclassified Nocardia TaxID=2637762 RepID=UPI00340CAB8E